MSAAAARVLAAVDGCGSCRCSRSSSRCRPTCSSMLTFDLGLAARRSPLLIVGGAVAGAARRGAALAPPGVQHAPLLPGRRRRPVRRRVPGTDPAHAAAVRRRHRRHPRPLYTWEGLTRRAPWRSSFVRRGCLASSLGAQARRRRARATPVRDHQARAHDLGRHRACWLLILLPALAGSYIGQVLMLVGLYILMGMGLNLEVGLAGLLDLGFVAFFAVGAYTTALLTADSPHALIAPAPTGRRCRSRCCCRSCVGVLFGLPVLGVRGDYLAVATMGLGEIVRVIVHVRLRRAAARRRAGHPANPQAAHRQLTCSARPGVAVLPDAGLLGGRRLRRLAAGEFAPRPRLDGAARRRGRGAGARHQPGASQAAGLRPRRGVRRAGRLDLRHHADLGLSVQLPVADLDQRAGADHRRRHGQPARRRAGLDRADRPAGAAARVRRIPLPVLRRGAGRDDAASARGPVAVATRASANCTPRRDASRWMPAADAVAGRSAD